VGSKFVSERNLSFLLYEVFNAEGLTEYERYQDQNRKMYDMVIKAAVKLGKDLLFPIFEEMDRKPPEYVDGQIKVHPEMKNILAQFAEGGWIVPNWPVEKGGEGLPHMIATVSQFIFNSANMSATAYIGLTSGAAHLIESFGDEKMKHRYLPDMLAGKWQGTMALTEPEAGSSLGDLTTTGYPTDKGHYLIKGQKIFISAGDNDATENVIHLMIGRIEGAPAGAKGISLFIVPKKRINENGELIPNDLACSGAYHKMGYKGTPIAQLSMGDNNDCHGWLVGEPNKGLMYMFQMMNEARIMVGMQATALAEAAYYASLEYTRTRCQGRKVTEKDISKPQVPIIEHADIKRMLLHQRAITEGAICLMIQGTKYMDLEAVSSKEDKAKYTLLLDVLTPIMKTYPSEMAIWSISSGVQTLGGSGYCDDYPLEQYFRDCRIHPIHEGTTGVQGMDLLGRKVTMLNGKGFELVIDEIESGIAQASQFEALNPFASELTRQVSQLRETTSFLKALAVKGDAEKFLADATLYLEYFGIIVIAWQWLLQGVAVQQALSDKPKKKDMDFYTGKMFTLRYFYAYELPKTMALQARLTSEDFITVEMQAAYFND